MFLSLLCRLQILVLLGLALAVSGLAAAPPDFEFDRLVRRQPAIAEMGRAARKLGATFGLYGGTVRDLYLGRPFSVISDVDLIYDSSEPVFPALRDAVLAIGEKHRGRVPSPDFHFDLSKVTAQSERQVQFHNEGITATKVGVLVDGRVFDPTHLGVLDLRARVFRFRAPQPRSAIDLHNVGRFVRDLVRLSDFRRDPGSVRLLERSLRRAEDASTEAGRRGRDAAARCQARVKPGALVTFRSLLGPARLDVRYLHDGQTERLTECFPVDLLVFDLFKCVTQADDMASMREVFGSLGVDRTLAALGLEREAKVLMDRGLGREELFAAFEFPGHYLPLAEPPTWLETWRESLRRHNYRTLFEMLASEFEPGSDEAQLLARRRDEFLSARTWRMLEPGDDFREELLGFLDVDVNLRLLPREKVERGLDWFLSNYLPLGKRTLVPLPRAEGREPVGVTRGWSPAVRAVEREAPHSMADLTAYLELLVGKELIERYVDPRSLVAQFHCGEDEARAILASRGFAQTYRVNACGFSRRRQTLLGHDPATGQVCVATFGYHAPEEPINEELRFYLLRGEAGRRILPQNILGYSAPESDRGFPERTELTRWLDRQGPFRVFFVGFTNPLKRLLRRARVERLGELQMTVGELPGARGRAVALSGFGASFGSVPAAFSRLLTDRGLETAVFLGSAGGLVGPSRRFQWVVPDRVSLCPGKAGGEQAMVAFENRALRLALDGAVTRVPHVTVVSPLVETMAWARQARAAGFASVDCELAHLVFAAKQAPRPPALYALLNVTDFPRPSAGARLPAGGISTENSPEQLAAVTRVLSAILEDLRSPAR